MIPARVIVTVDRPLGSTHPKHSDIVYPINYGFVEGIQAGDGEWQDVYVLGISEPVRQMEGRVIAVIHRLDDVEEKWVAAPDEMIFSPEEIEQATRFQEQYFKTEIRIL